MSEFDDKCTKCLAVRGIKHGKYLYQGAYIYHVVDGKWTKGAGPVVEMTKGAKSFWPRVAEVAKEMNVPVLDVKHGQSVEAKVNQ